MPEEKRQVFISYSRRDLAFVEGLAADLKAAGLDVWYDLSGLEGGARWRIEIEKAIQESQYVVIVLSPDSVASVWVEEEYLFASKFRKKILPLFYKQCDLPLGYYTRHFIDIQGENYKRNFDEVLRSLGVDLRNRRAEQEAAEKAAREIAEKEASEKAARERAKKEAIEKANRERAQRERVERRANRKAAYSKAISQIVTALKSAFEKSVLVLRVVSILGIIAILFLGGSWVMPKIIEALPTVKPSLIPTLTATKLSVDVTASSTIAKTPKPTVTPTKIQTPTPRTTVVNGLEHLTTDNSIVLGYAMTGRCGRNFNPEGKLFGTTTGIYEVMTGNRLFSVYGNDYSSVNFSPDGNLVAVGDDGLYEVTTGERHFQFSSSFAAFNPDSTLLAVGYPEFNSIRYRNWCSAF